MIIKKKIKQWPAGLIFISRQQERKAEERNFGLAIYRDSDIPLCDFSLRAEERIRKVISQVAAIMEGKW